MQGQHMDTLAEEEEVAREASGGMQLAGLRPKPAGSTSGHAQQVRSLRLRACLFFMFPWVCTAAGRTGAVSDFHVRDCIRAGSTA
jgi:hypothetical protein